MAKCPKCGAEKSKTSPDGAFVCGGSPIADGFYESPLCIKRQLSQATAALERVRELVPRVLKAHAPARDADEYDFGYHDGLVKFATWILAALEGRNDA